MTRIDVDQIDDVISKLQELRKLTEDPNIKRFVYLSSHRPIHRSSKQVRRRDARDVPASQSSLRRSVLLTARSINGRFSVKDVLKRMKLARFPFSSSDPEKSVANALRSLVQDRRLRVRKSSKGGRLTIYSK